MTKKTTYPPGPPPSLECEFCGTPFGLKNTHCCSELRDRKRRTRAFHVSAETCREPVTEQSLERLEEVLHAQETE